MLVSKIIRHIGLIISLTVLISGCGRSEKETILNLKLAADTEYKASGVYAAYAHAANDEALFNIGRMFTAISKAEQIHLENHMEALRGFGEMYQPQKSRIKRFSTLLNLGEALAGETYKNSEFYPPLTATAQRENLDNAVRVFSYANSSEATHARAIKQAISTLEENGNDKDFPAVWLVCPVCGLLDADSLVFTRCPVCNELSENFIMFD